MKFSSVFFAKNLKNWREALDLSQEEFAATFQALKEKSSPRAVISSYETKESVPKLEFIFEVAEKSGASLDLLFSQELDFEGGEFKGKDIAREPTEPNGYKASESELSALKEKLDMLWNTNLHRAEKMEGWEQRLKEMQGEIERLTRELEIIKKAGKG